MRQCIGSNGRAGAAVHATRRSVEEAEQTGRPAQGAAARPDHRAHPPRTHPYAIVAGAGGAQDRRPYDHPRQRRQFARASPGPRLHLRQAAGARAIRSGTRSVRIAQRRLHPYPQGAAPSR
eukprot:ctg_1159.g405